MSDVTCPVSLTSAWTRSPSASLHLCICACYQAGCGVCCWDRMLWWGWQLSWRCFHLLLSVHAKCLDMYLLNVAPEDRTTTELDCLCFGSILTAGSRKHYPQYATMQNAMTINWCPAAHATVFRSWKATIKYRHSWWIKYFTIHLSSRRIGVSVSWYPPTFNYIPRIFRKSILYSMLDKIRTCT